MRNLKNSTLITNRQKKSQSNNGEEKEEMKRYKTVSDSSDSSSRMKDSDSLSVVSISSRSTTNHRRFNRNKRINSELSEPLTSPTSAGGDEESSSLDPYFVFRSDLQNKIELADEDLADFLRIVQETVRSQSLQPSTIARERDRTPFEMGFIF